MAHTPLVSRVPGHHAGGDIAVQFLTSADEFARLAPDWNHIHGAAAAASVFNSWVWQYQWWQVYGGAQPLRILVALEHGETLGILALYIQTIQVLGVPVRLLLVLRPPAPEERAQKGARRRQAALFRLAGRGAARPRGRSAGGTAPAALARGGRRQRLLRDAAIYRFSPLDHEGDAAARVAAPLLPR